MSDFKNFKELPSHNQLLENLIHEKNNEIKKLKEENEKMRYSLRRIADKETLENGDKYASHQLGWEGVAEFARQAMKEVEE